MNSQLSEGDRFENAVHDAVAAVREGDAVVVASDWAAQKHDVEHRFDDLRKSVQEAIDDDG